MKLKSDTVVSDLLNASQETRAERRRDQAGRQPAGLVLSKRAFHIQVE